MSLLQKVLTKKIHKKKTTQKSRSKRLTHLQKLLRNKLKKSFFLQDEIFFYSTWHSALVQTESYIVQPRLPLASTIGPVGRSPARCLIVRPIMLTAPSYPSAML